jgi:gas vesicle protein
MPDEGPHPVALVLAGLGLGALLAGAAVVLLRSQEGEVSAEAVQRAARQLRQRAETLARRAREQTTALAERSREELEEAIRAGRRAAEDRRRELEDELHGR